ncbi:MAG: hypothetical protein ABIN58_08105 [candidate division WOR-3 bacterium]
MTIRARRVHRRLSLIILAAALCSLFFFPADVLYVSARPGPVLLVERISRGDYVTLSHMNSLYNELVEEVLTFDGRALELAEVKTASYGVKEYYRITEGIERRSFTSVTFMNSASGQFQLTIKGKAVEALARFMDQPVAFGITRCPLAYYLSWRLFRIFPA